MHYEIGIRGGKRKLLTNYRDLLKGEQILLSNSQAGQAEQLSKSRKKFLATTYKHFPDALYITYVRRILKPERIPGLSRRKRTTYLSADVSWPDVTYTLAY